MKIHRPGLKGKSCPDRAKEKARTSRVSEREEEGREAQQCCRDLLPCCGWGCGCSRSLRLRRFLVLTRLILAKVSSPVHFLLPFSYRFGPPAEVSLNAASVTLRPASPGS